MAAAVHSTVLNHGGQSQSGPTEFAQSNPAHLSLFSSYVITDEIYFVELLHERDIPFAGINKPIFNLARFMPSPIRASKCSLAGHARL